MTLNAIQWATLPCYPERPFAHHRSEELGPFSFARVLSNAGLFPTASILIPTVDADRGGCLPRLLSQVEQLTYKPRELLLVLGDRRQGRAINACGGSRPGESSPEVGR
jgi:hypothetical protein